MWGVGFFNQYTAGAKGPIIYAVAPLESLDSTAYFVQQTSMNSWQKKAYFHRMICLGFFGFFFASN